MKVEIKKIGIMKVIFSVFSVAVFVVMLLSGILGVFSPEVTINVTWLTNMLMSAILNTVLFLVFTVIFLGVYNTLCGIGIRGITVELEDKE